MMTNKPQGLSGWTIAVYGTGMGQVAAVLPIIFSSPHFKHVGSLMNLH